MSHPLDPIVPDPLRRLLEDDPSETDDFTILVISLSGEWAHLAMVSRGEVVCVSDDVLGLALWPTSTACANISERSRATLCAVVDGVSYSLRVLSRRLADIEAELGGTLACFRLQVEAASGDQAPYARLESGIRFSLIDPEPTVRRWRAVRKELRRAVAA